VLIERPFAAPLLSGNGYAIAKEVELADPLADLGARALREVAWRTSDAVGDGTTTAMLLTRALLAEGVRASVLGLAPRGLQRGLERAVEAALAELERCSRAQPSAAQLAGIATLAATGDGEVGALVADAAARVGNEGVILVEEGRGLASELEVRDGLHYDQGYVSAHFVTDEKRMVVELEAPYILLHPAPVADLGAIVPVLNAFAKADRPLLLIAQDVTGEALATLVVNKRRAGFKVAAAHAPGAGERRRAMLEDLAIATGGALIAAELGTRLQDLRPEMLGRAKRVLVTREATTIVDGAGRPDTVTARCGELRRAIEREKYLSYDREQLQQRLARLVSGIAVVQVGGATETALKERKERAEAAVNAVRAAIAGGIVPGGGAALVHASKALGGLAAEDVAERAAIGFVRRALCAPARQIAANAGVDGGLAVARLLEQDDPNFGYDAATGKYGDLVAAGIVDPTRVVATALRNAVSTAAGIIATEAAGAPTRRA
jgi:chaperonin GroEL